MTSVSFMWIKCCPLTEVKRNLPRTEQCVFAALQRCGVKSPSSLSALPTAPSAWYSFPRLSLILLHQWEHWSKSCKSAKERWKLNLKSNRSASVAGWKPLEDSYSREFCIIHDWSCCEGCLTSVIPHKHCLWIQEWTSSMVLFEGQILNLNVKALLNNEY